MAICKPTLRGWRAEGGGVPGATADRLTDRQTAGEATAGSLPGIRSVCWGAPRRERAKDTSWGALPDESPGEPFPLKEPGSPPRLKRAPTPPVRALQSFSPGAGVQNARTRPARRKTQDASRALPGAVQPLPCTAGPRTRRRHGTARARAHARRTRARLPSGLPGAGRGGAGPARRRGREGERQGEWEEWAGPGDALDQ